VRPTERLVVLGTNDRMDIDTSYEFTAQAAGTRVVVTTDPPDRPRESA